MRALFVAFIFLWLPFVVNAQVMTLDSCNHEVKGKVIDASTQEPLSNVLVQVEGTDKTTFTDEKGHFLINGLCDEENTLICSCLGYCDTTCANYHQHNHSSDIHLHIDFYTLGEIVIPVEDEEESIGTQTMSQVTLTQEELTVDPSLSLGEALAQINGVTFTSTGTNVQLPVIHGLFGNRILVLNNGVKHGFQNWGNEHAPEIDINSAEKITLLKGAAGVRYGAEGLGGAINIEPSMLPLNKQFAGKIGTGYQTNGRGYHTTFKLGQGFERFSYQAGGSYKRIGDRNTPDYSLTNSGKEEIAFNTGLRYHLPDVDISAHYSFIDQNLALLRASFAESSNALIESINISEPLIIKDFSYAINEPNQRTQHHLARAKIDWWYTDNAKLILQISSQYNQRKEFDVRRNAELPIIDLSLTTNDFQLEWEHPAWGSLDGLIGAQLFTQNNDNNPGTGTTAFIPNYNTNRYSAFIIENIEKEKYTFEFGLRLDHEFNSIRGRQSDQSIFRDDYSFTNFTTSLGIATEIGKNIHFRSNIGTAFRTPNVAELYSFGQQGFFSQFGILRFAFAEDGSISTNAISPASSSSFSLERGYKWVNEFTIEKKRTTYTITPYAHYIENYVFNRPIAIVGTIRGPLSAFITDQTNALFAGVDFTYTHQYTKQLNGTLGASFLWSRNVERNETLINQSPATLDYKLVWHTKPLWKLTESKFTFSPRYTFRQYQAPRTITPSQLIDGSVELTPTSEIFDIADAPEGYTLLNVSWSFKVGIIHTQLELRNLLNQRYRNYLNQTRYFADEIGRNFLVTLNYQF